MSGDRIEQVQLLAKCLGEHSVLAERGYELAVNDRGDLLVCRRGHWRGMWRYASRQFGWIVAGTLEPRFQAADMDEVISYSLDNIFVE